jgi:hypothetical protein
LLQNYYFIASCLGSRWFMRFAAADPNKKRTLRSAWETDLEISQAPRAHSD